MTFAPGISRNEPLAAAPSGDSAVGKAFYPESSKVGSSILARRMVVLAIHSIGSSYDTIK